MTGPRTETLRDEAALAAIEPAWRDLWARSLEATPFQSPAWLRAWWGVFRPGKLRVVAVHAGSRLVALAPLYLEEGGHGRRLLPLGMSVSDYLDVLVDPAHPGAGVAVVEELDRLADWERIELEELPPGAAALRLPSRAGWREGIAPQSACPVLRLPLDGDLAATLPAMKLRKLRMARRRADRRGWRIEQATADTAPAMLDALFRLHGARWRSRGEAGVLADDDIRAFHRAAVPGLLADGVLRLATLSIGDTVAGVYYGLRHRTAAYAYLGGFDPAFTFESPGSLLMGDAIAEALGSGAETFHFLRGQEVYKYEWGAVDRWNSRRRMERAA